MIALALFGCADPPSHGLHEEVVALDELGTPAWRTGPGETESQVLKAARLEVAAEWFPAGTSAPQAASILKTQGYTVIAHEDGGMGGQRLGRWFCRPGTEVELWIRDGAVYRAEVRTFPAFTLLGGTIC